MEVEINLQNLVGDIVANPRMNKATDTVASSPETALVKQWVDKVTLSKGHFEKDRKEMLDSQEFVTNQEKEFGTTDHYTTNIVLSHIKSRVSKLYAKNPKVIYQRRPRLESAQWDGSADELMTMMQTYNMELQTMGMANPQTMADINEIRSIMNRRKLMDRLGRTLELVCQYQMDEQPFSFKQNLKDMIRRALTSKVGYVKISYHRQLEKSPETITQINDVTERLAFLEKLVAANRDGDVTAYEAEMEEMRLAFDNLMTEGQIIRDGVLYSFPRSRAIIVDPRCKNLKTWEGARWVAEEYKFTSDEVKEVFNVELSEGNYTQFLPSHNDEDGSGGSTLTPLMGGKKEDDLVCVYEVWDRKTGTVFHVADGYDRYLKPPMAPALQMERFFPYFAYTTNDEENEKTPYCKSDVELLKPMQMEINRAREQYRQHRKANMPQYATSENAMEQEDMDKLKEGLPNEVLKLRGLQPGRPTTDVLQQIQKAGIDPAVYDVNFALEDIQRVVGTSEESYGRASKGTATSAAIAEGSRVSTLESNIDDLDEMLTDLFKATGQVCLMNMSEQEVIRIVGQGAVWPELSRQEVANEIYLKPVAGSSGRPNKEQNLANWERMLSFLLQIPGINMTKIAEELLKNLDPNIELSDYIDPSIMSVVAQNALAGAGAKGGGDAAMPQEGAPGELPTNNDRAALTDQSGFEGGSQAMMPAPTDTVLQ